MELSRRKKGFKQGNECTVRDFRTRLYYLIQFDIAVHRTGLVGQCTSDTSRLSSKCNTVQACSTTGDEAEIVKQSHKESVH